MCFLQLLPVAWSCQKLMTVYLFSDVPTSLKSYDYIVTFLDHWSKRAHWIPCTGMTDTTEHAHYLFDAKIQLHVNPREIISDRGVHITLHIWAELSNRLPNILLLSRAFHPQTERLSVISNKQVTWYLRLFITYHQDL